MDFYVLSLLSDISNSVLFQWGCIVSNGDWQQITLGTSYSNTNYIVVGGVRRVSGTTSATYVATEIVISGKYPKTKSTFYLGLKSGNASWVQTYHTTGY